jgi:hypothetical protein
MKGMEIKVSGHIIEKNLKWLPPDILQEYIVVFIRKRKEVKRK